MIAVLSKVDGDDALKQKVDAASDASAVMAIARAEGSLVSPASLSRHLRS